uniref:LITAF domain-containing protein n=1 Tax=Amphilophus citrinellus TaxID=61819 RepID=A0A3Q0TD83_AMPCI
LEVRFTPEENVRPPPGSSNVVYVEPPPTTPGEPLLKICSGEAKHKSGKLLIKPTLVVRTVILDLKKLPTTPCRTQCPECRQFVTTETYTSVSSVTWLVFCFCLSNSSGCCLIPFCIDKFKSVTHRCPKCRTSIQTIKKL